MTDQRGQEPEKIRRGVIKSAVLETVCGITSTFPKNAHPEFAFAGKSNVGKSSLINGLMNRKALARTSSQPGKTQTINYYHVNDEVYLVDLPGYGYTKASVEVREKWGKMVERYLKTTAMLKAVFLLVDIRHEPSQNDKVMYDWIVYNGYHPIVIATKLDKINRSQVQKHVKMLRTGLGMVKQDILIPFSAQTKQGRDEIWELMDRLGGKEQ
ncbi:MAG: YihA family ribosome biogenesis GTP-binding protein [Hungatella sp.]|nr:YihA family ribosome biogenesis GTP-binding protein [Hungatella sp.]